MHYTAPPASIDQYSYRWRNDDGAETAGTSLVAENTPYLTASINTPLRLRFTVDVSTSTTSTGYRLQYAEQSGTCSASSYSLVPIIATDQPFDMVLTSHYANGDASTNVTTGSGVMSNPSGSSFAAGSLVESTSNSTAGITLNADQFTEIEFALQVNSNIEPNTRYCFRLVKASTNGVLEVYTTYPELEVDYTPPTTEQAGYRLFEDGAGNATDGATANIDNASDFGALPGTGRQIVRDSKGMLYAVVNDSGSCEVWKSSDGATWDEQDPANNPDCSSVSDIGIAIDSTDTIHIVFTINETLQYTTFSGALFGSQTQLTTLSTPEDSTGGLSIAVDSANAPHVAYQYSTEFMGYMEYKNRTGGSWRTAISIDTEGHPTSLVINEDDIPELVWIDSGSNSVKTSVGNQNNATSFTQYTIDSSVNVSSDVEGASIAIDSSGNTWVAYVDSTGTNQINLAKHNDGDAWTTWQTPVTNGNVGNEPSIVIDNTDIYIFYEDSADGDIKYDMYDGSSWLGETTLQAGTFQDVKARHATYFNNDSNGPINNYVYYFNDSTPSDPGSVWTNDANAFDGNVAIFTNASSDAISTSGSNYLEGSGTTAPTAGETIVEVRLRVNGQNGFGTAGISATAFSGSDNLGTATGMPGSLTRFGDPIVLSEPTGGWTWSNINALSVRFHTNNVDYSAEFGVNAGKAEIIVITSEPTQEIDYLYSDGTDVYYASLGLGSTALSDVGAPLAAQDTGYTSTVADEEFRLRILIGMSGSDLLVGGATMKLQYVDKGGGTCAAPSGGTPSSYTDVTTSTLIAYRDVLTATDGNVLTLNSNDPFRSGIPVIGQTYIESNPFSNLATVSAGSDGLWDFALKDNSAPYGTTYCLRVTLADGTPLDTYTHYAEVTTISPITTFNQRQGIIENDQNGINLTSHTAKIGERMKVKIQVDTGTGGPLNKVFKLQYDKNDSNWSDVAQAAEIRSATSEVVRGHQSTGTGDAGACTGGVSVQAGYLAEETSRTKAVTMTAQSCYDFGFIVDTKNAIENTTYRFRLYNMTDASALTSYVAYPSFTTVDSSGNDTRYAKSNTVSLSDSFEDLKQLLDDQGYDNASADDATREILQNVANDTTADVTMTGEGSSNIFGGSVASAGDVNGDGYDDIIVGANWHNSYTGRAYIYYGGPSMDATADVTMTGEAIDNYFGVSVASAGDVNGDGYDDVIVGAIGYSSDTGRAYIFYGGSSMSSSITASSANVIMTGETTSNYFGWSVASAGDTNSDGYADVIVGASTYSSSTGRAYVYYGGSSMNNTADVTMTGEGTVNRFGSSVASAGDVNGDGYDDIVVGASYYFGWTGRAYIYYGGPSMDNIADVTITGGAMNDFLGYSVASAGDVNGDGYDDIIVGAWGYSSSTGRAYIFYGGTSMPSSVAASSADVTLTGGATNDDFGYSVASAGDINGDGYSDVIVGARGYSTDTGRTYIFHGGVSMDATADATFTGEATTNQFGASVAMVGDVNGDGFNDIAVGAYGYSSNTGRTYVYYRSYDFDATADRTMTGVATSYEFGYSVASAGDVNGDGYDDVIVGARRYSNWTGLAYIFYGGPSINTAPDITLTSETSDIYFGHSVASAGDVNGDGYDDVIVGAPEYLAGNRTGRAYIYYGGSSMNSTADVTMTGNETSQKFGWSVASAGDVNSDGYDDVIVGSGGWNRANVYYGGASMDSTSDVTLALAINGFGNSVAPAGDVNGDGYDDVIVGAENYSSSTGRAYIYYGGSSMDTTADVTMTGEATGNYFGASVASAGDVNGDGYDDVIVGARDYSAFTGRAYIFYGGPSMDNTADVTMTGEDIYSSFGNSVASAGDVNGDGYDDVVVGSYLYDVGGYATNNQDGRAYIFYGGLSMDNMADTTMTGEVAGNNFGNSVASAGDINGDGYIDIIIGAPAYSSNTGRTYLYLGGQSEYTPTYTFAKKHTSACSTLDSIEPIWNGQSTTAASSSNVLLQVYRFGSTNAWETLDTESALAADTDGDLTSTISTNLSEYCDGSNWAYFRAHQASGNHERFQSDYFDATFIASTGNTAPDNPSSLAQTRVTAATSITTGGWTNEGQVLFSASASDTDDPDTLYLCIEAKPIATAFDGTGEVCGSGEAYSGSPVTVEATVTGLSEGEYHWQARVKDDADEYSSWVSYGGNAESARDYGVDTTAPTGVVYDGLDYEVDITFNDGSLNEMSAHWVIDSDISGLLEYEISLGTTPGGTEEEGWSSMGTFTGVTADTLTLETSVVYYVNIRTTDNAGNQSVISSNGQMVAPTLTFTKSTNTVDLGALNASNSYTASQTLTLSVTTNAQNGYQIYGRATDFLKNQNLEILGMFSGGSYASPAGWGSSTGFGYHSSDTLVGGTDRFNSGTCLGGGSAPCFAPYATSGIGDVVADGGGPSAGGPEVDDDITITNKASIDAASQESGEYQTTVLYSAYATY